LHISQGTKDKYIVSNAHANGLITVIYTNGSELTQDRAKWLADKEVSLAFKLDSLREEKYDQLTGRTGSYRKTMQSIEYAMHTSMADTVLETDSQILVRLLFTTVGCILNLDEYVSLARFATNHKARWMMESLNHRGDAVKNKHLAIDLDAHANAMKLAIMLNPQQDHNFAEPCRLFSCITIRKRGEIAICPQDYDFIGNIRNLGTLEEAIDLAKRQVLGSRWRENWTGVCPVKSSIIEV